MGSKPFINLKFPSADYGFPNKARPKFNITISSWKIQFMVLFMLWYFLGNFYHTYLRLKNAFSVRPVQAVAMAMTKVVIPKVEWIGTRAARKDAVADSQHNKSKKLKKPTINWKKGDKLMSVRLGLLFLWWFLIYFNIKGFPYQESSKSSENYFQYINTVL